MSGIQTFANGIKHYIDTREIDESQLPEKTAEEALICLAKAGIIEPVVVNDGSLCTNDNGVIYSL
jgi:hypothetical protein